MQSHMQTCMVCTCLGHHLVYILACSCIANSRAKHMHIRHLHRPAQAISCQAFRPERCGPHSPLRIPVKQMLLQAIGKLHGPLYGRWHIWQLICGHPCTFGQRVAASLQRLGSPVNPRGPRLRHWLPNCFRFRLGRGAGTTLLLWLHGCVRLHSQGISRRAGGPA